MYILFINFVRYRMYYQGWIDLAKEKWGRQKEGKIDVKAR